LDLTIFNFIWFTSSISNYNLPQLLFEKIYLPVYLLIISRYRFLNQGTDSFFSSNKNNKSSRHQELLMLFNKLTFFFNADKLFKNPGLSYLSSTKCFYSYCFVGFTNNHFNHNKYSVLA